MSDELRLSSQHGVKSTDILFVLAIVVLAFLPVVLSPYQRSLVVEMIIWSIFACSFNLLFGYAGMLSFGQALFFGIGGYAAGLAAERGGITAPVAIVIGTMISGAVSGLVGLPLVRLRNHAFTLATLALCLTVFYLALSQSWLTGGDDGFPVRVPPVTIAGLVLRQEEPWVRHGIAVVVLALAMALYAWLLRGSAWGEIFRAIRDDAEQAALAGYRIPRCRLVAWTAAGLLAGLAGSTYAMTFRYVNSLWFSWTVSGDAAVWTILGGSGTSMGPLVGTALLIGLKDGISTWNEHLYPVVVGSLLVATMLLYPDGLLGWIARIRRAGPGQTSAAPCSPVRASDGRDTGGRPTTRRRDPSLAGSIVLQVVNVSTRFGSTSVLRDVKFTLMHVAAHGGPTVLVGPNGAGKSVLIRHLSGLTRPDEGRVLLQDGHPGTFTDVTKMAPWDRATLGISVMPQSPAAFASLSVRRNLWIAAFAERASRRMLALPARCRTTESKVESVLEWLDLAPISETAAGELSYGQLRRLQFGMAVVREPRVLLLDEPTTGLGVDAAALLHRRIAALCGEEEVPLRRPEALLVVEHDLRTVRELAGRVAVLHRGRFVAGYDGDPRSPHEILAAHDVQAILLGSSGDPCA